MAKVRPGLAVWRAQVILGFVQDYFNLERRDVGLQDWIALKLSCSRSTAGRKLDQAKQVLGDGWVHSGDIMGCWASAGKSVTPVRPGLTDQQKADAAPMLDLAKALAAGHHERDADRHVQTTVQQFILTAQGVLKRAILAKDRTDFTEQKRNHYRVIAGKAAAEIKAWGRVLDFLEGRATDA